ncbi:MAG TPA: glycoside hydrolase family 3 C-terminal domain-containing protein [Polyangiaceae bacterium]|nr:glycoside hydrolase family 3 C-terminal domain-containing protein [Polyangiaceae bacterium]
MPSATPKSDRDFENPDLPHEARIDDLLRRMTLAEKVACFSTDPSVPRLGVLGSRHVEGLHGLALGGPGDWGKEYPTPTTTFPQAIGLAATWNPELVRRAAAAEAREARFVFHLTGGKHGGIVVRAPNADLGRDPRWGRTEECYGEDAFLTSELTKAFVRGLQGDHPRYWQTASLMKHFLANSNEDGRERTSSDFDAALFHDYYSAPFRAGVREAGSRAYMAAYNAYNGIPCAVHPVLKQVTVEQWGQNGIICTDGGAFKMLVNDHHFYEDLPKAAAAAIHAGITQFLDDYKDSLNSALEQGLVGEADLDHGLRGNFRVMLKLGLLDPPELVPYTRVDPERPPWLEAEQRALAREVTRESIVLLKNERSTLPLARERLEKVAIIGALADQVLCDWYSGTPPYTVSPLAGIRAALGPAVSVSSADGSSYEEAERLARAADIAILCVGSHPTGDGPWAKVTLASYGKEAVDRRSLTLEHEELVKRVYAVNPRCVLVLISSFPYAIQWSQENVPAIVHLTHNSQELGNALADVLFGDYNPAGRLVQSWPRSLDALLPMMDYDIRHGRTYQYLERQPLYPFGYGLSFTEFRYSALTTDASVLTEGSTLRVSFALANVGGRDGDEVVQLYGTRTPHAAGAPRLELLAFQRVALVAGETRTVTLELPYSRLERWSLSHGRPLVAGGELKLAVGRSSQELELFATISVHASGEPG